MAAQEIEEGPAEPASVVLLDLHSLQERQHPEEIGIPHTLHTRLLSDLRAVLLDILLHSAVDGRGNRIRGTRFVIQPALESPIRSYQGVQRFFHIAIDSARCLQ